MNEVQIDTINETNKNLLSRSVSKPKVFVSFTEATKANTLKCEFGIQKDDTTIYLHKSKTNFTSLTHFDKVVREYFHASRFVTPFPKKPSDKLIDELNKYFFELIKIPGFVIFSPFVELFHFDPKIFGDFE